MRFNFRQALVLGIILLGLRSGQAQNPSSDHSAAPSGDAPASAGSNKPHDDSYVIGNDDVLAISVWNEPNLTKSIPVRSDGKISMPLIGEMQASGRTPLHLELEITGKLKNYITAPQVSVIVEKINSKKFNILGEVIKPGSYPTSQASTVVDAIALAGGFRDFAKKTGVYVLRKGADGRESKISFNYKDFIKGRNPGQNIQIEPNDTIIVP
jgi:polysaccharide biosynthesis/export protein